MIEALKVLNGWALGDGPLPRDEEAEYALGWYFDAWDGDVRLLGFFLRAHGACVDGLPNVYLSEPEPTMKPSEALQRVEDLAELRRALGRIKLATRRALDGDRLGTVRALRGAVDVFGEARVSDYVRLQWRVAELEAELREMEAVKATLPASP
jgi:hypothetical protein